MPAGKRRRAALLAGALLCALLPGCTREPVQRTILAMDTVMNLTVCEDGEGADAEEAVSRLNEWIVELEGQLSVTKPDSPVYRLNHAQGEWTDLGVNGSALLEQGLELCERTGGALDVTAYPAVRAWGFTTGEYRVPEEAELAELAGRIDYSAVERQEGSALVRLPEGMELDLGAVAKGYAGDVLAEGLRELGVGSALLDLGQSTIVAVGAKPGGSPWRIGIQDPGGDGYLGVLELEDQSMGTSGGYQRYFMVDGETYWHILDPDTAAPARSGLAAVTVVSPSGLVCDGLSTALFVMGLEESVYFWQTNQELDFEAIFVLDDGSIYITAGLEEAFSLADGYIHREVTVLR